MTVECFWVELTGQAEVQLRRWTRERCLGSATGPCRASTPAGRHPTRLDDDGYLALIPPADYPEELWPDRCAVCQAAFGPLTELDGVLVYQNDVHSAVDQDPILERPDTGEQWPSRRLPVGAMFDGTWLRYRPGPDGIALVVVTPDPNADARSGFWNVAGVSGTGASWKRRGDPRVPHSVSAEPSLRTPWWHGWLQNGYLVDA